MSAMDGGKRAVMVFEDNPNIRQLLIFFFQKRNFAVIANEDGTDAVAQVRERKPALIVMDLIMPGKDGLEAVADLRREGDKTPIIMLTSKNFAADRERALAAGVDAYLLKPFNPLDLERTLSSLLPLG
jgi:DNA-binding response OmpR family regulator